MLTEVEKNKMLEMLGAPVNYQPTNGQAMSIGMVKIEKLIEYRGKTDEEIRAELALFDIRKKNAIQKQLDKVIADKAKLEELVASLL